MAVSWSLERENWGPLEVLGQYDLAAAFYYHNLAVASKPVEIVAELEGSHDGPGWHWILRLEKGTYAYVSGWCDYTGWDCQSNAEAYDAPTLEAVLRLVPEAPRGELEELMASGKKSKPTSSSW